MNFISSVLAWGFIIGVAMLISQWKKNNPGKAIFEESQETTEEEKDHSSKMFTDPSYSFLPTNLFHKDRH